MPTDQDPQTVLARGRYRLQQVIVLLIGIEVVVSLFYMATLGTSRASQQLGRFLVTGLLCWALWRGARWSRWVILVLVFFGMVVLSAVVMSSLRQGISTGSLFLLLMLIGYFAVGRILLWSKDVAEFMAAQRARQSSSTPAAT